MAWLSPNLAGRCKKPLAHGLGYKSLYDFSETSKVYPPDQPVSPGADVRQAIGSSIKATLQSEASVSVDQQKVEELVNHLSLKNS